MFGVRPPLVAFDVGGVLQCILMWAFSLAEKVLRPGKFFVKRVADVLGMLLVPARHKNARGRGGGIHFISLSFRTDYAFASKASLVDDLLYWRLMVTTLRRWARAGQVRCASHSCPISEVVC